MKVIKLLLLFVSIVFLIKGGVYLFRFFSPSTYSSMFHKEDFIFADGLQKLLEVDTVYKHSYRCEYVESNWCGIETIFTTQLDMNRIDGKLRNQGLDSLRKDGQSGQSFGSLVRVDLNQQLLVDGEPVDWGTQLPIKNKESGAWYFKYKGKIANIAAYEMPVNMSIIFDGRPVTTTFVKIRLGTK